MSVTHRITPCLWFDNHAEEAARFYTSIFPNSRITAVTRYSAVGEEIQVGRCLARIVPAANIQTRNMFARFVRRVGGWSLRVKIKMLVINRRLQCIIQV